MNLTGILFNPNGRIGPASFWRGVYSLMGIWVVIQAISTFGPTMLSILFVLPGIALVYPFVALYAKRLHDSGRTGWWFLLAFLGFFILSYVTGLIIQNVFAPDAKEMLEIATESGNFSSIFQVSQEMGRSLFLPTVVQGLAIQGAFGYIMASLKSESGSNRFGPPEGGDVDVFN